MKLLLAGTMLALAIPAAAAAQSAGPALEGLTVTARDPAGLLERQPSDTVFGLSKPLLETPRSASFVSAATLDRYGVRTLDDLTAVAPGAFTDSYYGVSGSLNLRGSLAENYFRGFKRVENRGTYPTPLPAADQVEIVRGPPTPVYGAGKVGGLMNFVPRTARVENHFLTEPTGEAEVSLGAYGLKRLSGQIGAPLRLGTVEGGVYAYAEAEGGGSYYRGIDPDHQLAELSADLDLGQGWSMAFGGMAYRARGYVQTPGWNRLTQALIDNGTYTTGRNTVLVDKDGNGRLTPNEIGPGGLIQGYFGFTPPTDPRFVLNSGVGATTLSPRTVFISNRDFSDTDTATAYLDLARKVGSGALKLQLFYDDLSNQRFVSYGFPADYHAHVQEARASWSTPFSLGAIKGQTVLGASFRSYRGTGKESFNGGDLSLDRRDLSVGATPTDIFDDPFSNEPGGIGLTWETDVRSHWRDAGLFGVADLSWSNLTLTLGGRYDDYRVSSSDHGTIVFGATPGREYTAGKGDWTYSASLAWKAPGGLMPYVTYAEASALEVNQAGGVAPSLVSGDSWLSGSRLAEAGVKARLWGDVLTGSLAVYRQARTQLSLNNAVQGTRARGVELELRWLASNRLSFTFAGDLQTTRVKGPDNSFIIVPPSAVGVSGVNGYGGAYALYTVSTLIKGDYTNTLIPRSVVSLFAVYTGPRSTWGQVGGTAGVTAVSSTSGILPGAVRLPAYAVASASAYLQKGPWRLALNVDNLFDRRYFTPVADVYANVAALPGVGRTWRLALRRAF
ncbi:MAG TPA: TonB-dependent receptor [Caulobacteraceae bacterium]|jgi:iron complex outermembrane receptor protein|nr:TonB-dependent receptor [Caulobacteraceae bacterium]